MVEEEKFGSAAQVYGEVAAGESSSVSVALSRLTKLLREHLAGAGIQDAVQILGQAARHQEQLRAVGTLDIYERGMAYASSKAARSPGAAALVFDAVAELAPDTERAHQEQEALWKSALAVDASHVACLSRLAELYERTQRQEECLALLQPHEERLGTSEGARILGQLYSARGKYDEAYTLLTRYTEDRMSALRAAESRYDALAGRIQQNAIKDLNDGKGPDSFYRAYDRANEAEQTRLVHEYVSKLMNSNAKLEEARETMMEAANVIPVALDLGQVLLRRAQENPDAEARSKDLDRAEKVFRKTQSFAGETDEYRMFLGQVYYWMGKADKGKKLFEEMLMANARSPRALLSLAHVLREIGSLSEARLHAKESFEKAQGEERGGVRKEAARLLSILAPTLEEKLEWQRRTSPTEPNELAHLRSAEGNLALQEGNEAEAIRLYRESLTHYESVPRNAAKLNNEALVWFSLAALTGERSEFEKAMHMIEEALALEPGDSILLSNAASSILTGVLTDLLRETVSLPRLKSAPNLEFLVLHDSEAERQAWVKRLRDHPATAKGLGYLDKVMLLAPRSVQSYRDLVAFHGFLQDEEKLAQVLETLKSTELDLAEIEPLVRRYLSGEQDERQARHAEVAMQSLRSILNQLPDDEEHATLALGLDLLTSQASDGNACGLELDWDDLVALSQRAYERMPCVGTRDSLQWVLIERALQRLMATDAEFKTRVGSVRRSFGSNVILSLALEDRESWRQALLGDADIRRVVELVRERMQKLPSSLRIQDWALLRHVHPEDAERVAKALRANKVMLLTLEIEEVLAPLSANGAYENVWVQELLGNPGGGDARVERLRKEGIPVWGT